MPCGYVTGIVGEAMTLKLRAPLGLYIQKIIYIGWVQLSFLVFPKDIDIAFQNRWAYKSLAQIEWRVNRSNIAIYMTDICVHSKLWLQMWLSVTWNVKGSIDCSVLFCNVTLVLTLSVTLDTWCIMSVAETRIMVTENIRGILVGNNIRPLNSWHPILLQSYPVHNINDNKW